jgi:hypothetical protein
VFDPCPVPHFRLDQKKNQGLACFTNFPAERTLGMRRGTGISLKMGTYLRERTMKVRNQNRAFLFAAATAAVAAMAGTQVSAAEVYWKGGPGDLTATNYTSDGVNTIPYAVNDIVNLGANGAVVTSVGTPISFGFSSTNRCLGVASNGCAVGDGAYEAWRNSGFQTQVAKGIYNGNQVWYNTGAQPVALGGGGEFANGDVALVTLDTHAQDVPTWTLLFSPLTGPTHVTITGYGGAGVGTSGIGSLAGIVLVLAAFDFHRKDAKTQSLFRGFGG